MPAHFAGSSPCRCSPALAMLTGRVQDDVAVAGHVVDVGRAYPLLCQSQSLCLFEPGAGQQIDDEGAAQAFSQRLIERSLEQQQGVAVLAEQIQQHQIVALLALVQEMQRIGVMQPRRAP